MSYRKSDKTDEKIKLSSFDALIEEYLPPDDISISNIETDTSKESEGTTHLLVHDNDLNERSLTYVMCKK